MVELGQELVEIAFSHVGLNWKDFVKLDPAFLRRYRFVVEFPRDNFRQLVNLTTSEVVPVQRRQAVVDVDRKSGEVYELV